MVHVHATVPATSSAWPHDAISFEIVDAVLRSVFDRITDPHAEPLSLRRAIRPRRAGLPPPFVIYEGEALPLDLVVKQLSVLACVPIEQIEASADIILAHHGFTTGTMAGARQFLKRQQSGYLKLSLTSLSRLRLSVLRLYGGRCAISGCEVAEALDAWLILPVEIGGPVDPANGILLRSDIGRLFEAGELQIDPESCAVSVSERVLRSYPYWRVTAQLPPTVRSAPFLKQRWADFLP